jgi:hypothetical protein
MRLHQTLLSSQQFYLVLLPNTLPIHSIGEKIDSGRLLGMNKTSTPPKAINQP